VRRGAAGAAGDPARAPAAAATGPIAQLENELYRVAIDRATGAMNSLKVKSDDWEVLSGKGNVVSREQDRGDLWELYKGLDGASRIAMTTRQHLPKRGEAVFSDEGKGEERRTGNDDLRAGPLGAPDRSAVWSWKVRDVGPGLFRAAAHRYHDPIDQS
jgi:hypothetical protein